MKYTVLVNKDNKFKESNKYNLISTKNELEDIRILYY